MHKRQRNTYIEWIDMIEKSTLFPFQTWYSLLGWEMGGCWTARAEGKGGEGLLKGPMTVEKVPHGGQICGQRFQEWSLFFHKNKNPTQLGIKMGMREGNEINWHGFWETFSRFHISLLLLTNLRHPIYLAILSIYLCLKRPRPVPTALNFPPLFWRVYSYFRL